MRALICFLMLLPSSAFAHVGHLIELGGHSHWIAGAAIGIAAAAGVWGALKGDTSKDKAEAEADPEESDPEESAA